MTRPRPDRAIRLANQLAVARGDEVQAFQALQKTALELQLAMTHREARRVRLVAQERVDRAAAAVRARATR